MPPLLFFLSGGYENFHSQYPELCTEVKTVDQSGSETEKRVNSHSEKLSHHKPDYDQVWKHPLQYTSHSPTQEHTSIHLPVFISFLTLSKKKKKKTTPHPADIRETYIWHHNIFST